MMNKKAMVIGITILAVGLLAIPTILVSARSMEWVHGNVRNGAFGLMGGGGSFPQMQGSGGYGMMGNGMIGGSVGVSPQQSTQVIPSQNQQSNGKENLSKHISYQVIKVNANDWSWTLNKDHLKYGKPIEFIVNSTEGTHGFSIMGTDISAPVSAGSQPQDIVWEPSAKGTYTIACNIYCGAGHRSMIKTFTVS